eukprot:5234388-Pleurochrysis_carterae.AAC.3
MAKLSRKWAQAFCETRGIDCLHWPLPRNFNTFCRRGKGKDQGKWSASCCGSRKSKGKDKGQGNSKTGHDWKKQGCDNSQEMCRVLQHESLTTPCAGNTTTGKGSKSSTQALR